MSKEKAIQVLDKQIKEVEDAILKNKVDIADLFVKVHDFKPFFECDVDDFMAKIIREVKNNSDDFDNLLRYNRDVIFDGNEKEEAFEDGIERGYKKGYGHGVEQKAIDVAKAMLQKNYDIKDICEITKLSLDEIEKLKEELE